MIPLLFSQRLSAEIRVGGHRRQKQIILVISMNVPAALDRIGGRDGTKVRRGTEAKHQHDFVGTPRSFLELEVPPLPVTPPVTPGRAEIPSLICAVR